MQFKDFQLSHRLLQATDKAGWTEPTPIQREAIPTILAGSDLLGLAQTGTGKTGAFVLPILQMLEQGKQGVVRALIIAPTRELAEQLNNDIRQLSHKQPSKSLTVYGGRSFRPQLDGLKKGVDIIVATPGRLLDHMQRKTIDLKQLQILVLDEADRMFDMGFLPDIRKILRQLPRKRQNLLFSATMPFDVRSLADEILNDPVTVQIDFARPAVTVRHALYEAENYIKASLLQVLLENTPTESVLIFTRTKHRAADVSRQLRQNSYQATSLHGDLTQGKRQRALDSFRNGKIQILVATDLAARGLDISQVSHVINYDMPATADDYTHRIGRTGRASRSGDAFTFVTREDEKMVNVIEQVLGEKLERLKLPEIDYTPPGPVNPKPLQAPRSTSTQSRYRRSGSRTSRRDGDR